MGECFSNFMRLKLEALLGKVNGTFRRHSLAKGSVIFGREWDLRVYSLDPLVFSLSASKVWI